MDGTQSNDQLLKDLLSRVEALEREAPKDQLTLGVISGDLERAMFAFMVALGATVFDTEVEMFFALRGIAALRDPKKIKKDLQELEPSAIKFDLQKHGAMPLEELIQQAGEMGVRITICNLSMDLMEISREELIDYPHLTFAGVATLIEMSSRSKQTMFM
ncbi:MAG: DsrE/DsrF/DrsH-like family protein [Alphaproteobacteria bacterium]